MARADDYAAACERMAEEADLNAGFGDYSDEFRDQCRTDAAMLRALATALRDGRDNNCRECGEPSHLIITLPTQPGA